MIPTVPGRGAAARKESRRREPGQHEQDWFCAEQEIVNGKRTTSTAIRASAGGLEG